MAAQNWTEMLLSAGIPEPPGRAETIAGIKAGRAKRLEVLAAKACK